MSADTLKKAIASLFEVHEGGDVESEAVERWSQELSTLSPAHFCDDEVIRVAASEERFIVPGVFRVAEAALQLFGWRLQASKEANPQPRIFVRRKLAIRQIFIHHFIA